MVWHGSTYIVPQDRSFQGTLHFFGQVDSVPWGLAVIKGLDHQQIKHPKEVIKHKKYQTKMISHL